MSLNNVSSITESEFEKFYTGISGFGIEYSETKKISDAGSSSTYGEIKYSSLEKLLDDLKISSQDVFYDLGSGVGKVTAQVYLNSPAKKCIGIELSDTRHDKAQKAKSLIAQNKKLGAVRELNFVHGDIVKENIDDATVVFMCSTCYPESLMKNLTEKFSNLNKNLRILSLKALPENNHFKLTKTYQLPMTWSSASTVHLYEFKNK